MPLNRARFLLATLLITLAACQPAAPAAPAPPPPVNLTFTYWGSEMERAAIEGMVAAFETRNPDIDVQPVQIPYEEYLARITALTKQGQPPRSCASWLKL